jgi:DNA-binding CsgD family transcriptional regulator
VAEGWNFFEIADRLGISPAAVKFRAGGIYRKFGVKRRGMIEW